MIGFPSVFDKGEAAWAFEFLTMNHLDLERDRPGIGREDALQKVMIEIRDRLLRIDNRRVTDDKRLAINRDREALVERMPHTVFKILLARHHGALFAVFRDPFVKAGLDMRQSGNRKQNYRNKKPFHIILPIFAG